MLILLILLLMSGCGGDNQEPKSSNLRFWNEDFFYWECKGDIKDYQCVTDHPFSRLEYLEKKIAALENKLGLEFKNEASRSIPAGYIKAKK